MATPEELSQDYFQSMARGRTGTRLAEESWAPVPAGYSPAMVSPPPVAPTGPTQWVSRAQPVAPPGGVGDMDWDMIERSYGNLPIAEAQKAINAAMQYQAMRGYKSDLESGKPAAEALSRWMPLMIAKPGGGNLAGVASMIRATQPKPNFAFVPGQNGAPPTFQAPGQRPVIVPRSAMPISTAGNLLKEEVAPGILAVRAPGATTVHIVKANGAELSQKDRLLLLPKIHSMQKDLAVIPPSSPEYKKIQEDIKVLRDASRGITTVPVPEPIVPTNAGPRGVIAPPRAEVPIPAPVAPPARSNVAAAAPAAKRPGKAFKDRSGKTWRYLGTSANPKTDRNPENWVEE